MDLPPLYGVSSSTNGGGSHTTSYKFDVTNFGLLSERDFIQQAECVESCYDVNDGGEVVRMLRKTFQVLNPGGHVSKRNPENGSISFIHCHHAVPLGKKYQNLRRLMTEHARIDLFRDCMVRIKAAATYVQDIENLVMAENRTLYAITHDCITSVPISKLVCLNALCEDLRTQIGHWNCLKQKLHTNQWLQPILGELFFELDHVRTRLLQLRNNAIWWLERLIQIGLQVFAHGDLKEVTHEVVWNITRGLEDFNNIVNGVKMNGSIPSSKLSLDSRRLANYRLMFDHIITNSLADIGENVKVFPFTKMLQTLANERSKHAALVTHRFFTRNDDFMRVLHSSKLPAYTWNEDRTCNKSNQNNDTSDYHTATGSTASLSASILRIGSLRAPDLSSFMSPLLEMAQREHSFAESFLLIVCNSTNLLQNTPKPNPKKPIKIKADSPNLGKPPKGHSDTLVLSRSDSVRKSVSWGDSADSSIRSHLVNRYMDMMWSCFGDNLLDLFQEPYWGPSRSLFLSEMGSLLLCDATVIAMIRSMVEHACLKDMFPQGSVEPILKMARRCQTVAAFRAWDTYMCQAMGSQQSDKCYPCPLINGEYSTRTGMLLRDMYQPLLFVLGEALNDVTESEKGPSLLFPRQSPDVSLVVSLSCRLVQTESLAFHWCSSKAKQFLTSWSVANFLLVSQTDLKLLTDESQKTSMHLQTYCKARQGHPENRTVNHVSLYLDQIKDHLDQVGNKLQSVSAKSMQMFCSSCTKATYEYFQTHMPTGKVWRMKAGTEVPKEHNLYMEHALETVLEPVLEGVSKLKQTSQLSVATMATVAFADALSNFILKEKIKFSYLGASQLELDIDYMKTWLKESITNETVRQSVLDLVIFKYLNGAVALLKRQPLKRDSSLFRKPCSMESLTCEKGSKEPLDSISINDSQLEEDIHLVSNIQQWLDLRVHGGRSWRLPLCFNPKEGNG
ncbi:hypothetical protein CHS0354_036474 [Potamilus streckersoni]|uniref:Coiled-coil protein 142 C-terminal domain-containing protein n=1 Tax=Potamilus streckersoni TaxID=2493646 RepID=A0AAE0SWP5_9BIVA|nr:hypothetical protein CHS0354_036474 [Potamilus streckersoni]